MQGPMYAHSREPSGTTKTMHCPSKNDVCIRASLANYASGCDALGFRAAVSR